MIATITNLKLNTSQTFGNGKTYDGHLVTYQPPPWKGQAKDPVEKFIFKNADVAADILKLSVGDRVDIQFETNGKFKNPVSFKPATSTVPQEKAPQKYQATSSGGGERDDAISRAVAIKEASTIVGSLIAGGGYTAANVKKREFIVQEVVQTARELLPFLKNEESLDGVVGDEPPYDPDLPQDDYND